MGIHLFSIPGGSGGGGGVLSPNVAVRNCQSDFGRLDGEKNERTSNIQTTKNQPTNKKKHTPGR